MELSKHDIHDIEYKQFWNIFSEILDKNVPKKRKGNHENQGSFMNKNSEKLPQKDHNYAINFLNIKLANLEKHVKFR